MSKSYVMASAEKEMQGLSVWSDLPLSKFKPTLFHSKQRIQATLPMGFFLWFSFRELSHVIVNCFSDMVN